MSVPLTPGQQHIQDAQRRKDTVKNFLSSLVGAVASDPRPKLGLLQQLGQPSSLAHFAPQLLPLIVSGLQLYGKEAGNEFGNFGTNMRQDLGGRQPLVGPRMPTSGPNIAPPYDDPIQQLLRQAQARAAGAMQQQVSAQAPQYMQANPGGQGLGDGPPQGSPPGMTPQQIAERMQANPGGQGLPNPNQAGAEQRMTQSPQNPQIAGLDAQKQQLLDLLQQVQDKGSAGVRLGGAGVSLDAARQFLLTGQMPFPGTPASAQPQLLQDLQTELQSQLAAPRGSVFGPTGQQPSTGSTSSTQTAYTPAQLRAGLSLMASTPAAQQEAAWQQLKQEAAKRQVTLPDSAKEQVLIGYYTDLVMAQASAGSGP